MSSQLTFRAAGMHCDHCRIAVTEEVTAIDEAGYDAVAA